MRHVIVLALAIGAFAEEPLKPEEFAARQLIGALEETPDPALVDGFHDLAAISEASRARILDLLTAGLQAHPEWVRQPTESGWPRLHLAAFRGQADIVRLLLDFKAPMVAEMEDWTSEDKALVKVPALLAAVGLYRPPLYEGGDPNVAVVELLLSRGADANAVVPSGRSTGMTALHAAASRGGPIVRSLLFAGAVPEARDARGRTPLHSASSVEVLEALVEAGAPIEVKDAEGWTPIDYALFGTAPSDAVAEWLAAKGQPVGLLGAVALGNAARVKELLDADPSLLDAPGRDGRTPLHWAITRGRDEVATMLIERGASAGVLDGDGNTPLLLAVHGAKSGIVSLLLDKGADPAVAGQDGWTPLLIACQQSANDVVEMLLAKGADAKRPGPHGETVLHLAADGQDVELVASLLASGADVNAKRENGDTSLLVAISYLHRPDNLGVVEALLLAGADPNAIGSSQRTPLDLAGDVPEFADLLRRHGATK